MGGNVVYGSLGKQAGQNSEYVWNPKECVFRDFREVLKG